MQRKIKQGKGVGSKPLLYHFRRGPANIWEKTVPGRGNSQCRSPGRRACLVCLRNSKEASGQVRVTTVDRDEVKGIEEGETKSHRACGPRRGLGLDSEGSEQKRGA